MSPDRFARAVLKVGGEKREFVVTPTSAHGIAILEELRFVRREAQAEADLAYADWRAGAGPGAYAVYRAAQDRADAAQDDLARWAQRMIAA